jgi:hypothetical protein
LKNHGCHQTAVCYFHNNVKKKFSNSNLCTSATIAAPPAVTVARRGDWSLRTKVSDIYWVSSAEAQIYDSTEIRGRWKVSRRGQDPYVNPQEG